MCLAWITGIMSEGDVRWLLFTFSISIFCSSLLTLGFWRMTDPARVIVYRCGMPVMISVFGSKAIVHYCGLDVVREDMMLLGFLTIMVTVVAYFFGHGLFKYMDREATHFGSKLFKIILRTMGLKIEEDDDKKTVNLIKKIR